MGTFVLHFKMNKSIHHMNNHTIYCLARHAGQYLLGLFMLSGLSTANSAAQTLPKDLSQKTATYLSTWAKRRAHVGNVSVDSIRTTGRKVIFYADVTLSYIPMREPDVKDALLNLSAMLPKSYRDYSVEIRTDGQSISDLVPAAYRTGESKKIDPPRSGSDHPLITRLSSPATAKHGLNGRHIALWQSHGLYYERKLGRWEWQRARTFGTVEDLYTQSYVLPYLVPMLERAGANVLLPRERDTQGVEIIIDNDGCRNRSTYTEKNAKMSWRTGEGKGFAHLRDRYMGQENPFREGTYRAVESIAKGKESTAEWTPDIPRAGRYAVYVSYKTLPNSTEEALYTVHHKGGSTRFAVNQRMGGGTWIYLGHFDFDRGRNPSGRVVLSNLTSRGGEIVTADGVKIGGGKGNIARGVTLDKRATTNVHSASSTEEDEAPTTPYPSETSGYPRFTEAARYWMQWAGVPDSIYSPSGGKNDYTDDYRGRGKWVNYLAGGTSANPQEPGLGIPIDLSFAFHSDAGTTTNDSTMVGTLGIFCTDIYDGIFADGSTRYASRDLTDMVQSSIVHDVRTLYEPRWRRRAMWNRPYSEARTPRVPAMLLELLSHQNFADMRLGLDPRFRFTVSRAIYKGMLRFLANRYGRKYAVQPLPVDHMQLRFVREGEAELSWRAVQDPLEPTAEAKQYIVYIREGDGAFDNGTLVSKPTFRHAQRPGVVYSYQVTAVNDGGESFPSETLSAGRAKQERGVVMVINGFDRISAPDDFSTDSLAGFTDWTDHGVPYINDISYIGSMKEFRRSAQWTDDDAAGFGDSRSNYDTVVIAGNTFDYPALHGQSILRAGYSFVSCSNKAVEDQMVDLKNYRIIDLILGKQRRTKMGRGGVTPLQFEAFSRGMQRALTDHCKRGGHIFVSGTYVGSDLFNSPQSTPADQFFATNTLHFKWRVGQASSTGQVRGIVSPYPAFDGTFEYYAEPNPDSYVVESPDGIEPADESGHTVMRYAETRISAGVVYAGKYRTCIFGFPFESIKKASDRDRIMQSVLGFLDEN